MVKGNQVALNLKEIIQPSIRNIFNIVEEDYQSNHFSIPFSNKEELVEGTFSNHVKELLAATSLM